MNYTELTLNCSSVWNMKQKSISIYQYQSWYYRYYQYQYQTKNFIFSQQSGKFHHFFKIKCKGRDKSNGSHLHIQQQTNRKIILFTKVSARRREDVCGAFLMNACTSSPLSAVVAVFGLTAFSAFATLPVAKNLFTNRMMMVSLGTGVFGKLVMNAPFTLFKEFVPQYTRTIKIRCSVVSMMLFLFLQMRDTLLFIWLVNMIWGSLTCYICLLGSVVSIYIG